MSTPRVTTTLLKPAQDPARVLVVGAGLGTGVQALWSLAAQQLPEDTVVVGYDLPGHGASEPHAEPFSMAELADAVVAAVQAAKARGGRVIAVGTTSVRSLETAARDGELKPFSGDTDIFIYPGRPFHVVDALVTNFHLPESTLLMLVSAFAGYAETMAAYREAVAQGYRFFSYGDAMFITRNPAARGPEV